MDAKTKATFIEALTTLLQEFCNREALGHNSLISQNGLALLGNSVEIFTSEGDEAKAMTACQEGIECMHSPVERGTHDDTDSLIVLLQCVSAMADQLASAQEYPVLMGHLNAVGQYLNQRVEQIARYLSC